MSDLGSSPRGVAYETLEESSAVRPLATPDIIDGRYRVLGRIGAGAVGVVLRADDIFLDRPVAIKIVESAGDPAVRRRFLREAQALAQLRHENIVQVYAFGPFQSSAYLAMELVIGDSLERVIDTHLHNGTTVPLPRAIGILRAIARGLEAVHARGIVHRDVKPANVIIENGTDRPVLIDFGLARRRSTSSAKASFAGGTPMYMAPEQAKDRDDTRITAQTDVYALACTAFELFTGHPVFEGEDIYTVLLAHMTKEPRRVSSLRPELAPLDDVLHRALSKEPQDRHASVTEMVTSLEAALARVTSVRRTDGPRVLVLASEAGLSRSLVRNATRTLRAYGREIVCETVEDVATAASRWSSEEYALVIVDEDSTSGRLAELVQSFRTRRPGAEVVVITRELSSTRAALSDAAIRHIVPKPVNVHMLAAVLGRLELAQPGRRRHGSERLA